MRATTQLTRQPLLPRDRTTPRRQPRLPSGLAQTAQAQLPHAARTRRGGPATSMTSPPRATPFVTQMRRGRLPASSCRHQQVDGHHRQSGRNAFPQAGSPPIEHHVADPEPTRSWTKIRLGARARNNRRRHGSPHRQRPRGRGEGSGDTTQTSQTRKAPTAQVSNRKA
jgi:hypothetical protein